MLKIDEVRPGIKAEGTHLKINGTMNGNGQLHSVPQYSSRNCTRGLTDAFELLHTCRGINFRFGVDAHIPAHTRPLHRHAFLIHTSYSFVLNFLILDILDSALKFFPGVGTPSGGSIFYGSLNLPLRLAVATTIHIMTGSALLSGFKMVYDLVTLFAVGICHSPPENWPPVMDDPWRADSLHRFWAKDWHQLLRRTFFVYGGYPARQLYRFFSGMFVKNHNVNEKTPSSTRTLEDFFFVLGTFLASGLWHECTMYAMGKGFSWMPILFFVSQSALLVGERVWRKMTGKRVGGMWGRLWVYFVIFILAQIMGKSFTYFAVHRAELESSSGCVAPPWAWWWKNNTTIIESNQGSCDTSDEEGAGYRDIRVHLPRTDNDMLEG